MAKSKIQFRKPATTHRQQIARLEARGLVIDDTAKALHSLTHLNYYRLRGYTMPFEIDPKQGDNRFKSGTTFEHIINLYDFDRALRLHLMEAVEHVEVSVRTVLASYLALNYAPHAHMSGSHFKDQGIYWRLMTRLLASSESSKEPFAKHFRHKYSEPLPPVWAVVELMTLGQLSNCVNNLRRLKDMKRISDSYQLPSYLLPSFLHHLSTVRNTCAHHGRLWNKNFTITPTLPNQNPSILVTSLNPNEPRKLYNTLTILAYLMDIITPGHSWNTRLVELVKKHKVDIAAMGFPADYQTRQIWLQAGHSLENFYTFAKATRSSGWREPRP